LTGKRSNGRHTNYQNNGQRTRELEAFTQGYLQRLVADDRAYEGFDEFYSYNDKWDINIHAVGQKVRTIYAQSLIR
jgi:hypothetical protein